MQPRRATLRRVLLASPLGLALLLHQPSSFGLQQPDGPDETSVLSVVSYLSDGSEHVHGSGFVATLDGVVVTAFGVIDSAASIRVFDRNGREIEGARVVESDPDEGYSLIRVAPDRLKGLRPVKLGDSDLAKVGDSVVALNVPLGFERSVMRGRINGWTGPSEPQRLLTSLPRNQATIGGPLFNKEGEVIGIQLDEGVDSRCLPINRVEVPRKAAGR